MSTIIDQGLTITYNSVMRKPGTDEQNVQMTDVLCDFCHTEWREDLPMVEGHQGSCICGNCLRVAFQTVVIEKMNTAPDRYTCPLCLETQEDRESMGRGTKPGWSSPAYTEAVICHRCIKQAGGVLQNADFNDWRKPRPDADPAEGDR